jgi:flagellar hook protein FlgE
MRLDADGNLVSTSGLNMQGYTRNPISGAIDRSLGIQNIQVPSTLIAPTPTTQFEVGMNLDGRQPTGTQFATSVQLFDSFGASHVANLIFKRSQRNNTPVTRWRFDLTIPANQLAGANPPTLRR